MRAESKHEGPEQGRQHTRRKVAYTIAAGATAACAAAEAEGQIVWSTTQNLLIQQGFSQDLEINGDEYYYSDLIVDNFVFSGKNYQGFQVRYSPGRVVGFIENGLGYATALNPGDLIDETTIHPTVFDTSLAFEDMNPNAQFLDTQNGYIGFGFPILGALHYGWVRVAIDNAAGTYVVRDWAYNSTPGAPIHAGQIAGDYNLDGLVDAADYTVYRDTFSSTEDLRADGNADGVIDELDYAVWAEDYGFSAFALPGASAATAIPEPVTLGLLAVGAPGLSMLRRARRGADQGSKE